MGYTYYTTYTPTAGYSATWSGLETRSGANSSGYTSIEQTEAFSGSRGYRTYRYTSQSGSTNIYNVGPASYTQIVDESASGIDFDGPTSGSTTNSQWASVFNALAGAGTSADYASGTVYTSTVSNSASTAVTHQYNYTTTSTSSSYYPKTSTTQSSTTTTTGTYSTSETYEDGTDTITDTWTEFATASTQYTSSNWTTAAGPTVTTSTFAHTITTTTAATDSTTRSSTILASSSYSVGDTLIDLAAIYEAADSEVYYSITATDTALGLLSDVATFFTKTTVTAMPGSTTRNYADISSLYVPASVTISWTNTTTTTGGTVTYTAGVYVTVTQTYGLAGDSLPHTDTTTETLRLLSTTTSSVTVHTNTTYSATLRQDSSTTTTRSHGYTTTASESVATASAYTATATATVAYSFTSSSSRAHTTVLPRTAIAWPFDYTEDGGFYSVTSHAGATYHSVHQNNSVSLGLASLGLSHWQATRGWNDPQSLGGTETRYLAMSVAGGALYYPFTAEAGPGSRLAMVLYSSTKDTTTGDTSYRYQFGSSLLSYTSSHLTDSTSTTGTVSFSGVSAQTHYHLQTTRLLVNAAATSRTFSIGGVPEVTTESTAAKFTGRGAFAVTRQSAGSSTVDHVSGERTFASTFDDHAVALVPEYLAHVSVTKTIFPVYSATLGGIGLLTRHPDV